MTQPTEPPRPLGRRQFLGGSVGALLTAQACAPATEESRGVSEGRPLARPRTLDDGAWQAVRDEFVLEAGTAYMNNASLGMPPASVAQAVCDGYRALSEEPLHGKHALQERIADSVLPRLAAFVGAATEELTLTRNASEALHFGALGLQLEPGDEVLITTQEHPAGRRPWEYRARFHGIHLREVFIPSPFESPEQVVELFARALSPRTRAIAFCHVTRGGHRYPVAQLAALARDRGIFCHVDGAQAMGMFPIDVAGLGCDTYAVSLHKWFLGPSGTGFLYVRNGARDRVHSLFAPDGSMESPQYGAPGTAELPLRASLTASLDFMETIGVETVEARTRQLSDYLKAELEGVGASLLSGESEETSCPASTIFEFPGVDALAAVPAMEARALVHLDEHQRDGHNAIRVSTHVYNTREEIDRCVEGLASLRG